MKKVISILLASLLVLSLCACGNNNSESSDNGVSSKGASNNAASLEETENEEKPELKILAGYQSYDYEEQPSYDLVQELSGYSVKFYMLPQENAEQKLLLEISGGTEYDLLLRMGIAGYSQLLSQNALVKLNDALDSYGDEINKYVSEAAWAVTTNDAGDIYGIPHENFFASEDDPYGALQGGIGVRSDVLEELEVDLPQTLDEFTEFLRKAKEKYGVTPLGAYKGSEYSITIASAFGLTEATYYDVDGVYTHRLYLNGYKEYYSYMLSLYQEGLLDNDMPINTAASSQEKFSNKTNVAICPLYFYNIPSLLSALETNNPDCAIKFIPALAADENTAPNVSIMSGSSYISCIPVTSDNVEHAVNYLNILSNQDNFKKIYVGEEGVSYEIIDGQYFPIFPAFDDYTNADKFTGIADPTYGFTLWQSRARKTDEMATAYDEMNADVERYNINTSLNNYGFGQEAVTENKPAADQAFTDAFTAHLVAGTDPDSAIADMISVWEANGGLKVNEAMQTWYEENKDLLSN